MKNIIVCCDGTWNKVDNPNKNGQCISTNVAKLASVISPLDAQGNKQCLCYLEGVGTKEDEELMGGAFGIGLSLNVLKGYIYISKTYEPGDKIFLFGFSRGAYTARSIAGFIGYAGIVKDSQMAAEAMKIYENRDPEKKLLKPKIFSNENCYASEVHFVGVWDTVGSLGLGIPGFTFAKILGYKWDFHDEYFDSHIKHARHALAIHEKRSKFKPVLHTKNLCNDVEEIWFYGVHADIGGGYAETGLSNITLKWMKDEAELKGLCIRRDWKTIVGINDQNDPDRIIENDYIKKNRSKYERHEEWKGLFKLIDIITRKNKGYDREKDIVKKHPSVEFCEDNLEIKKSHS